MTTHRNWPLFHWALCSFCVVCVWASAADAHTLKLTGVLFDGVLVGDPEPDSAIRIENTDAHRAALLGGMALVEPAVAAAEDSIKSKRRRGQAGGSGFGAGSTMPARTEPPVLRFPDAVQLAPGKTIWVAASARGFQQVFGFLPDFEVQETVGKVPNMVGSRFLSLRAERGAVALLDAQNELVDAVYYDARPNSEAAVAPGTGWKGTPVLLREASFYGWNGQVLRRDRDEQGHPRPDTDTAQDWDAGFSRANLGVDPTHRIEVAGQSQFVARPLRGVFGRVLATSAPDNNYQALVDAFAAAQKSIRVRLYEFTNPKLLEALIKARSRGVAVTMFLEGSPVGGIADQERHLVERAHQAGVAVWFLATPKGSRFKPRYRFDHSKYVIIDDAKVIIGSENYGRTGVPVFPSFGNRGWMVHIEQPALVAQLLEVWHADFRPGVMPDLIAIDASSTDAYGMPYRDAGFQPDDTLRRGLYADPVSPVHVEDTMNLELVLSPDTSLNENSALIGMISRAESTLWIEQNSIRRRWGKKEGKSGGAVDKDDDDNTPNLPLQAVVAAARRGVSVRVLLDSTWYNVQGDEERDNDDTVLWLNDLAKTEGLDIVAKVLNRDTTHLEKVHTKGVIVDQKEVFVGSINWTENSFKGNREVGVIVGHPKVAGYYGGLFLRDWQRSRIYRAKVATQVIIKRNCSRGGNNVGQLARGDEVTVVAERVPSTGRKADKELVCAEIVLPASASTGPARADGKTTAFIDKNALGVPEATPDEALHVLGREAIVEGIVVNTHVTDRRIQLRFLDDTRPPFTAVIFRKTEASFRSKGLEATQAFQGKVVRIRGDVTMFHGPEIVIKDPSQIEIVR